MTDFCKSCGRTITQEVLEYKAKRKSDRIIKAVERRRRLGLPVGRPVEPFNLEMALEMRGHGNSYETIAKALGCSSWKAYCELKHVEDCK